MNKNISNRIIAIILSFLLYILITILTITIITLSTFLSKSYFQTQLNKSNYSQLVYSQIKEVFSSYSAVSGFDEEFFTSIITNDIVNKDIDANIDFIYGITTNKNYHDITELINVSLVNNLKSNNISVSVETEQQIHRLADICAGEYYELITLPFDDKVSSLINFIKPAAIISFIGLTLVSLFACFLLFMSQGMLSFCKYICYSLISCSVTLLVPSILLIASNKIKNIGITDQALYNLSTTYANSFLLALLMTSLIMLVLSVALSLLYIKFSKTRTNSSLKV